ncbi:transporter [Thiomicrospira sp. WB1]|uniref:transporter n=1 Tax=Thiomicrospira sp. WB1 TaxID=1685380 RepID=UPI000748159A|nr:transporter [Thiomicrospira sp. WB1]KUJ71778.1 hypothetical protein AVO41_04765 [Thiomicrospira sp. WB1]
MKQHILLTGMILGAPSALADTLRPLAADRPDATESPQTVDPGHFQLETSFISYTKDDSNAVKQTRLSFFNTLFKYGISQNIDLHIGVSPYQEETIKASGNSQTTASHGDFEIRSKINLWGNQGGQTALALLPYLKIPSGDLSNDKHEGGLIATYAGSVLQHDYGLQLQVDRAYKVAASEYDWAGSHTLVTGYNLNTDISGYLEYLGEYTVEDDYLPYASLGWTWQNSANSQWDLGSRFALTEEGEDLTLFAGWTRRF